MVTKEKIGFKQKAQSKLLLNEIRLLKQNMEFLPTQIPEVILIRPRLFSDARGFFLETYREDKFTQSGIVERFVQDNHSGSVKGVLRGLHYQIHQPQGKLVRALAGEIFDVAVDIRRTSPTFGKWYGANLSAENKHQLWIPKGFAHGFLALSDWAEVAYKATDYYAPEWERCIVWNDPTIGIEWPVLEGADIAVSAKDALGKEFEEAEVFE